MGIVITTADFITRSNKKHNNKYSYSKSIYRSCFEKIIILCHIHGEFTQNPRDHMRGSGCIECGKIISRQTIIDLAKSKRAHHLSDNKTELILNSGDLCTVDEDNYEFLNSFNWSKTIGANTLYASATVNGAFAYMHRLIMGVSDKYLQVDHIDGNGLNNRKSNLRVCNSSQNQMNRAKSANKSSVYKGVCFDKKNKKWAAYICLNKKLIHLGRFFSESDAARAYDYQAKVLFGKFANLNFK